MVRASLVYPRGSDSRRLPAHQLGVPRPSYESVRPERSPGTGAADVVGADASSAPGALDERTAGPRRPRPAAAGARGEELARRAAGLFADDSRVGVLTGDWRLLEQHAPFDVFFCDGGGKRDDPGRVVDLLAPGGILVLDDFTPSAEWPPRFEGEVDELRLFYLTHPDLDASGVLTTPTASAIVAARRGAPR
ncbi:transferase [Streptomyces sp. NPDC050698]